ncbi:MAG: T9SS type A sorting domain-containing protein [Candidatus Cloacimonetes bacterium]|nr:T9SS type A sorting domain-containing protein [Candidatus Cloacimonadota bacterium]
MKHIIVALLLLLSIVIFANPIEEFKAMQKDISLQSLQYKNTEHHRQIRQSRTERDYGIGDTETFWAWSFAVMPPQWIQPTATCRAVGNHCYIFVADSEWLVNMNQAEVDTVLAHFEDHTLVDPNNGIWDLDTQYFGPIPDELDNDPKMVIFYSALGSYQGTSFDGYFSAYNQVTEAQAQMMNPPGHSNEMEMIYMTCYPLDPVESIRLSVLAHETQHLIHWGMDVNEYTWVDEGCAEYAMYLYGHPDPIVDFPNNPDNDLTSWDQHFSDYVQVYLFMVYLAENYGGSSIITEIVAEPANGKTGIENALVSQGYNDTFEDIVTGWTTANFLNDYQTITLPPFQCTSTHNTYPANGGDTVEPWAADYIKLYGGNDDLDISFNSAGGTFNVKVLKIRQDGSFEIVDFVDEAASGNITISAFSPQFHYMVLNIVNITNVQQSYTYSVQNSGVSANTFWVYNFSSSTNSQVNATRQGWGSNCNIYVEDNIWQTDINQNDVDLVVRVFEDSTASDPNVGIFELDTAMFGQPSDIDNNSRVNILIYDIDDDDINGYFSPSDISGGTHSNNMELLYIDKNPHGSGINSSYCFSTVAHEFQHLIHHNHDANEVTWANEGLSGFAQSVTGWISPYWQVMFTQNPDNNLVAWNGGADYPQTFLFMQYLWEHFCLGTENVIFNLVAETENSMDGLSAALATTGWSDTDAESVFNDWVVANSINHQTFENGHYSYADNPIGSGTFEMATADDISLYPNGDTNTMQHWSVNYITFDGFTNSLKVTFTSDEVNSDFHVRFVTFFADEPMGIFEMDMTERSSGEITLPNYNGSYDKVLMVVTDTFDSYATLDYTFVAEDVIYIGVDDEDIKEFNNAITSYPNPFNPITELSFSIRKSGIVSIDIYNIRGQKVKSLVNSHFGAGKYSVVWDGKDDSKTEVSGGIYFYRMKAGDAIKTGKMTLLK